MKAVYSLLAFAASALAIQAPVRRGNYLAPRAYTNESISASAVSATTETIYTTTSVCPLTTYTTVSGIVSPVTTYTISVITVTSCPGGCAHPTAPGSTTVIETSYTTVCPVTETLVASGTTWSTVYDTTSVVVTTCPATVYETT